MPANTHTILYIMRHIDIGGHIDIPYKKIGITGSGNADLSTRLKQISNTKSPIQAQCIAAWECDDVEKIENALHSILKNERVEGEWFYDKDDNLIERIEPIMELLKAKKIELKDDADLYTKSVLESEENRRKANAIQILGELNLNIKVPLESSIRYTGPTLFSKRTGLTYYINIRKSGMHNLEFGRSKDKFDDLKAYMKSIGFDIEKHERGYAMINGLSVESIADIINKLESEFIQ
ncbi:MAG: GIY-YIG nuclease family protein [Bacteroidales bacterium]|nr:GIY-YIG nuclease family protein [Bacteroidales bacterium]